jgi:hypothetical protein
LCIRETSIAKADIEVNIPNVKIAEPELVKANLSKIKYKNFIINNAKISALLNKHKNWDVNIQASGSNKTQDFDITSNGNLLVDKISANKEISLILNLFKGSYGENKFVSADKITFFSSNAHQSLLIPKLNVGNGEVSLNAKVIKEKTIDLVAHGKHISLKMLKDTLPEELTSQHLAFNLKLMGSLNNPQLDSDLSFYSFKPNKTMQKLNNMILKISDGEASISLKSEKESSSHYNLYANIPINFSLKPLLILSIKDNAPAQGKVTYDFDVSTISNIALPPVHSITGRVSGDLSITGTYLKPLVNGKIKYSNGTYNYLPFGLNFYNIDTLILAKNNIFTIDKLNAEDSKKNQLEVKGRADFNNTIMLIT